MIVQYKLSMRDKQYTSVYYCRYMYTFKMSWTSKQNNKMALQHWV